MATATKVLTELRHQGLVRAVAGVGTVVDGDRPAARPAAARHRHASFEGELTTERVVEAAISIADAEGLEAVSMRRVANEIGAATMSLYRHIKDKDDLVLKMMDSVFGAWRPPANPPEAWRPQVETAARAFWDTCRRHPWLAFAMSITRPQPLVGALTYSEFLLAALDRVGLDHEATFTTYITLVNYVRGMAVNLELESAAEAMTGLDDEEWLNAQEPSVRDILKPDTFPLFTKYVSTHYDFDLDRLFEFGLERLLDGLSSLAERQGSRVSR